MSNYVLAPQQRAYAKIEATFGVNPGLAAGNGFRFMRLEPAKPQEYILRRDKQGTRTFPGVVPGGRRRGDLPIDAHVIPNGAAGTKPDMDPFYQAAFGTAGTTWVGNTVGAGSTTTSIVFVDNSQPLTVGQFISYNGEARYVTAYNSSTFTATVTPPFSFAPPAATVMGSSFNYLLGTNLPSVTIGSYWDPSTAEQDLITGWVCQTMRLTINTETTDVAFTGQAQDRQDNISNNLTPATVYTANAGSGVTAGLTNVVALGSVAAPVGSYFSPLIVGQWVNIAGTLYTVATFVSPAAITLITAPGTQGPVTLGGVSTANTGIGLTSGLTNVVTIGPVGIPAGSFFLPEMVGQLVTINAVTYTVNQYVSPSTITLTTAPGTQAGVAFSVVPAEPASQTTNGVPIPGYQGEVWINGQRFTTLIAGGVMLTNNSLMRQNEFGVQVPQGHAEGIRDIEMDFDVNENDNAQTQALLTASIGRITVPVFYQFGNVAGQIVVVYAPNVTPQVPRRDDGAPNVHWVFTGNRASASVSNTELAMAFC